MREFSPFNKTFNRMTVRDIGGWWRTVIDYGAKSAKFCLGEGERGAIPTSALLPRKSASWQVTSHTETGTKTGTKSENHFSESALDRRWKFSERTVENLPKSLYCRRNSVRIDATS